MPELFLVDDFYRPTKFPSIRSNDHRSLEGVAIRETRIDEDNFDENGGKNYFNILGAYARMIAREITFSSAVVPFITKPLSLSLSLLVRLEMAARDGSFGVCVSIYDALR